MKKEFSELYERELKLLYETARDFAAVFPGITERLGGLDRDTMDPGIKGLIEGSAFLAARVQEKLKSEFSEFTTALLDQLLPNYLAPTPSSLLVQATPPYENPNLLRGVTHRARSRMEAVYVERERRVSCIYELTRPLTLWPLRLERAEYYPGPAPMQAQGLEVLPGTVAGLKLSFLNRTSQPDKDVKGVKPPGAPLGKLMLDSLPIHLTGSPDDVDALYEQLFASCRRVTLRYEDSYGDPHFRTLPLKALQQVGFDDAETLLPGDDRSFVGFEILRDYFTFPEKFAAFRVDGLQSVFHGLTAIECDLLFEFDTVVTRLAPLVGPQMFALYSVPATNLFEQQCSRVPLPPQEHEHLVIPDRSRWLDYEAHRIVDVYAHYPGRKDKVPVYPLYSLPAPGVELDDALYYTVRRLPRLETERERREGRRANYHGTEMFISLFEPAGLDEAERAKELSIRAMCSNRHLTEQLPVGAAGADFKLVEDSALLLKCIGSPTPPRDSVVHDERRQREATHPGPILWRLINFLSLNHLGLSPRGPDDKASGVHELMALFADLTDKFTERRVRGILDVATRPLIRRLRQPSGFNAARGLEITITLDEKAYEGAGIMIIGAVLDRFFSEYTSINSFTETVIASSQRGVVMRWPPRAGQGAML